MDTRNPPSSPRVCFLTTSYPRWEGDFAGSFVCKFAEHLISSGSLVTVVAPHDVRMNSSSWSQATLHHFRYAFPARCQTLAYGDGMPDQISKNKFRLALLPGFLLSFSLNALKASTNSDIVQAFWSVSTPAGLLLKWMRKIPLVIHVWGSDTVLLRLPVLSWFFKRILFQANAIVCESFQFKKFLVDHGIDEACIEVIPNGIDLNRFAPGDRSLARKELGLDPDKKIIITVGRMIDCKGQRYLIDSLPFILRDEPSMQLVFVGDGKLRSSLEKQVQSLGLKERVMFAGTQDHAAIPKWLQSADVFALPSLRDGSPNVILEAMACGLPIVSTPVNGLSEMVRDGVNGLLVPPESSVELAGKINEVLKDPSLNNRLSKGALDTIANHYGTWNDQARKLLNLYKRILAEQNNS